MSCLHFRIWMAATLQPRSCNLHLPQYDLSFGGWVQTQRDVKTDHNKLTSGEMVRTPASRFVCCLRLREMVVMARLLPPIDMRRRRTCSHDAKGAVGCF